MLRRRAVKLAAPTDLLLTLGPLRCGSGDPRIKLTGSEVARAAQTPDGPATIHLCLQDGRVEATAWGPGAEWTLEAAPSLLGCEDRPERFEPADATMRTLQHRSPGLRLTRSLTVLDSLVPTIIEQKVTSIEARRSFAKLVRRYGADAPGPFRLKLLPDPRLLAELPYFEFHPLGIERKRAQIIRAVAARTDLEDIATMDAAAALKRLMSIPGIGPWTAAIVVGTVRGEADVVVTGDLHFPNLAAWALAGEPRADDERMLELLEPYRGHRARAMRYILAGGERPPRFGPKKKFRDLAAI